MYKVKFETTKGDFVIEVHAEWAPRGAARFGELVGGGYYDGAKFFRVLPGFVVQFGLPADPRTAPKVANLADDPVTQTNAKGTITFAMAGPNTRTSQVFINLADNRRLDGRGFAPFGKVVSGMDVAEKLYAGYGEGAPHGSGPDQGKIRLQGNAYLEASFPKMDGISKASVIE
ncbi:MAG: peptidylprolyl isomerase [Bryobacteraceae bacterium]|jgi:peptidyl-prolyl cis-trans isomerase A (cyclophilin A)